MSPAHVPRPRNEPPSRMDRMRIHSSDLGLALLSLVISAQVLATALIPRYEPSLTLIGIHPILAFFLAVFIGVGGVLAIRGLLWSGDIVSSGWTLEKIGWILVGSGWLGYAALVAEAFHESSISYSIPGVLGVLALIRAYVVWTIEKDTRPTAEHLRRVREGRPEEGND